MNRLLLAFAVLAASVFAHGQVELKEFLAARQQYGIKSSLTASVFRDFTGSGVFELRCTVRGYISGAGETLLVEAVDGLKLNVRTASPPEFLKHTGTAARLLVKLTRATVNSEPEVQLVTCTEEGPVADHDAQIAAAQEAKLNRARRTEPSRSGGRFRPEAIPGNVPSLEGGIGRGQTGTVVDITPSPVSQQMPPDLSAVVSAYGTYITGINPRIDYNTATTWAAYIIQYSNEVGIDPRLEIALIVAESDFKPQDTSRPGAMGLCQLMPDEVQRFGLTSAYDPRQNIWASTRLLREGIDKYKGLGFDDWKSIVLALAGYNAGHGAVKKFGYSVPPYKETQGYVDKITKLYKKFIGSE